MAKGTRRPISKMFDSAVSSQNGDTIEQLKAEIEALKSQQSSTQDQSNTLIPVSEIGPLVLPNRLKQPRRYFSDEEMAKLRDSIAQHGVLEPILLRPGSITKYETVSGERRWRCSNELRIDVIPGVVKSMSDELALEIALIAHLMSENISALEETDSILGLLSLKIGQGIDQIPPLLTKISNAQQRGKEDIMQALQEEIAIIEEVLSNFHLKIGSFTQNRLPLLNLSDEILDAVREGKLSPTTAKIINKEDSRLHQDLIEKSIGRSKEEVKKLIKSQGGIKEPKFLTLADQARKLQSVKAKKLIEKNPEAQAKLEQANQLLVEVKILLGL